MSCSQCKWHEPGDDYYGQTLQKPYSAYCSYKQNMSNLKGFPFQNTLKCFEQKSESIGGNKRCNVIRF